MGKQNYRESVEKDRQEIAVERSAAPSRRAQRNAVKEKPKKTKNMLLPALFFIFILIPVTILFYVAFLFEPDDTLPTDETANEVSVESGSASPDVAVIPGEDEEQDETAADEQAEKEAAAKAQAEKEAAAKAQAEKEAAAKAQAEKEAAAKAQAEKEAAARAQAEKEAAARAQAEKEAAAKAQAEKEAAQKQTPPASGKTHTVQAGETLYRIAVNTYGAAGASAGVEKIKQANGLPSNEISVGQTLVLP
ncbi:LysM peptidoglycan-binding domain-containing protein [Planococcus ruber]|uniref:LysM peptidoglycan-binding domain-containing protein n=1 Tax=Planococcus ruber TaxID=2027871 RepID=UPI001FEE53FD|nr:LysM peptidoglycan-binding domain-containing protein [Planococcus ruber]MCJ1907345.1 LysM peptidoglycan-binding domain-containing protein [Planococcus ruber]